MRKEKLVHYTPFNLYSPTKTLTSTNMESEVLDRIQKMTLTTDEDEVMPIRSVRRAKVLEEFSLSLIGKFLTMKPINIRAAKNLLRTYYDPCGS